MRDVGCLVEAVDRYSPLTDHPRNSVVSGGKYGIK